MLDTVQTAKIQFAKMLLKTSTAAALPSLAFKSISREGESIKSSRNNHFWKQFRSFLYVMMQILCVVEANKEYFR